MRYHLYHRERQPALHAELVECGWRKRKQYFAIIRESRKKAQVSTNGREKSTRTRSRTASAEHIMYDAATASCVVVDIGASSVPPSP